MALDKNRYMTLLGDPIHANPIKSLITASDSKAALLAAIFLAVAKNSSVQAPEEIISNAIDGILFNITGIFISRCLIEKIALNEINESNNEFFKSKENLKDLCIDKTPEPQAIVNSTSKYGAGISNSRLFYSMALGVQVGLGLALSMPKIIEGDFNGAACLLSTSVSSTMRHYNGISRLNKLHKGEYAIVTMPPTEELKTERGTGKFLPVPA